MLRVWEDVTESELQQVSGRRVLTQLKVRLEALTRQRIIFVMTGISPKGSTDRLTHARLAGFFATSRFISNT